MPNLCCWVEFNLLDDEIGGAIRNEKRTRSRVPHGPRLYVSGLSVVSHTLCKRDVFPAFALPITRTRNSTFGTRERLWFAPIAPKCVRRRTSQDRERPPRRHPESSTVIKPCSAITVTNVIGTPSARIPPSWSRPCFPTACYCLHRRQARLSAPRP